MWQSFKDFFGSSVADSSIEKVKDYKKLVLCQSTLIITSLFVFELFQSLPFPGSTQLFELIFGIIGIYNNYLMYQMLRNFVRDARFLRAILYMLFFSVLISLVIGNPIAPMDVHFLRPLLIVSMFLSFTSFTVILYYMIMDIFGEAHETDYRLWGASAIFIGIGIMFSFLLMLLELIIPNSLHLPIGLSISTYIYAFNYSFYVMSGLEHPYEGISTLVMNLSVIESIISNLYVIILVGRLLSK